MIPRLKTEGYSADGVRLYFVGGGSSGPSNVNSTTNTSNIPTYAQPYVSNMLGATESTLFKTQDSGQVDPVTGQNIQDITGFQPYQAYGGVYDANGNLTNATEAAQSAVAGFQPLQTQAQQGIGALQTPDQYNQAMNMTNQGIGGFGNTIGQAGMYGAMGNAAGQSYGQNAQNPSAVQSYMNPYIQSTLAPELQLQNQQFGMQQAANQGRQTQAGAFGGSRGTLEDSLNQQNQMLAQNQLVGNAYNQAYNTANQNMQNAANLGMQGSQLGLAGVNAQQAGLGQQLAGANQLAGLGQQQLSSQENIYNLQNQTGAQQQQYNQNVINQAMQNYANAQQYPIMELGTMSNMLRGLPMQATTTNQYQANPNLMNQMIGAGGAAATIGALSKSPGSAKGGLQSTGINSYDVGGAIRADLENMPTDALQEELKKTQSPTIKSDIQQIMAMRSAVPKAKAGGIMSYAAGEDVTAPGITNEGNAGETEAKAQAQVLNLAPQVPGAASKDAPQGIDQVPASQSVTDYNSTIQAIKTAQLSGQINPIVANSLINQMQGQNKNIDQVIEELQGAEDRYVPKDTSREELMKEKANAKAEGERQRQLRLGQFFAMWGSTPGPTLVAGLKSFAQSVPGMIADSDKQQKVLSEIDRSISEIGRAEILRKAGRFKDATAIINNQADNMRKTNRDLVTYVEKQEAEKKTRDLKEKELQARHEDVATEAGARIKAAQIGAGSKQDNDIKNALAASGLAQQQRETVTRDIDNIKKATSYDMLKREVDSLSTKVARNPKDADAQARYKTKKEEFDAIEHGFKNRIEAADKRVEDTNLYLDQAYGKKGLDRNKTSGNTSSNAPDPNDPFGLNKKKQ